MPKSPFLAAATGLPSASIIPLPIQPRLLALDLSDLAFTRAFVTVNLVAGYCGPNEGKVDRALAEMMETCPDALERLLRESGEVLQSLRDLTAFLAAADLRLQSAANRFIEREML